MAGTSILKMVEYGSIAFGQALGGNESEQVLAPGVFLRIAKDSLGSSIPEGNAAITVHQDDRVLGRCAHRAELFLTLAQSSLG